MTRYLEWLVGRVIREGRIRCTFDVAMGMGKDAIAQWVRADNWYSDYVPIHVWIEDEPVSPAYPAGQWFICWRAYE